MTARIKQPGQDRKERTARKGQAEPDSRIGQLNRTGITEQVGQDR
jgi:hypothetical protein